MKKGCSVSGCLNQHKASGFCAEHYRRHRLGLPLDAQIERRVSAVGLVCSVVECEEPVKSKGLCKKHYARMQRHGTTELIACDKPCSVDGCEGNAVAKGLCKKHYYRMRNTGTTADRQRAEVRGCAVGGCTNVAVARDMCEMHYGRWKRHKHVLETRSADWGSREKHPLYSCWNALMRSQRANTVERWHDLWNFVADIGDSRPTPRHLLTRKDAELPFGPDNFYWRTPVVSTTGDDEKATRAAYMRAWNAANPEKLIERELSKRYGITFAQYGAMFDSQDGKCGLCGNSETRIDHRTKRVSRLAVDHCHKTGKVRQLLCHTCNSGLGAFKDDPDRLRAAIAYLERHAFQASLSAPTPAPDGSPRDYLTLLAAPAAGPPN